MGQDDSSAISPSRGIVDEELTETWEEKDRKAQTQAYQVASSRLTQRLGQALGRLAAERAIRAAREYAVEKAWAQERELARRELPTTYSWTPKELQELIDHGRVKGYHGHHRNTVSANDLAMARNPENITFMKGRPNHSAFHSKHGNAITGQKLHDTNQTGGPGSTFGLIGGALGVFGEIMTWTSLDPFASHPAQ